MSTSSRDLPRPAGAGARARAAADRRAATLARSGRSVGSARAHPLNLCFHGIGTPERRLEAGEEEFWLEVDQFEEMLAMIAGDPSIHITVDDSNASDFTLALPALLRHGLTATFFLVADRIDSPGALSGDAVRALVSSGMQIGTHGLTHRPWRNLRDQGLEAEMRAAGAIAEIAGTAVREAACPFGAYDRRVLRALRRHGFTRVYTVDGGRARQGAWLQPRYTVRAHDTAADLERLARSGRAFRAGLRTLIKRLR